MASITGVQITANHEFRVVTLDNRRNTLDSLQDYTNSSVVEAVPTMMYGKEVTVWVDEGGIWNNKEYNECLNFILLPMFDYLGDALITGGVDYRGDTKSVPKYVIKGLVEDGWMFEEE